MFPENISQSYNDIYLYSSYPPWLKAQSDLHSKSPIHRHIHTLIDVISMRKIYLIFRYTRVLNLHSTRHSSISPRSEPIAEVFTVSTVNNNQIPALKFMEVCSSTFHPRPFLLLALCFGTVWSQPPSPSWLWGLFTWSEVIPSIRNVSGPDLNRQRLLPVDAQFLFHY